MKIRAVSIALAALLYLGDRESQFKKSGLIGLMFVLLKVAHQSFLNSTFERFYINYTNFQKNLQELHHAFSFFPLIEVGPMS